MDCTSWHQNFDGACFQASWVLGFSEPQAPPPCVPVFAKNMPILENSTSPRGCRPPGPQLRSRGDPDPQTPRVGALPPPKPPANNQGCLGGGSPPGIRRGLRPHWRAWGMESLGILSYPKTKEPIPYPFPVGLNHPHAKTPAKTIPKTRFAAKHSTPAVQPPWSPKTPPKFKLLVVISVFGVAFFMFFNKKYVGNNGFSCILFRPSVQTVHAKTWFLPSLRLPGRV